MFIPFWIIIVAILILSYYKIQETDEVIAEMRDPGGFQRQALLDTRKADKAARKLARGPSHAIFGGIGLLCALLGIVWLAWGGIGVLWAAWLIVGPCVVTPAMLAARKWLVG